MRRCTVSRPRIALAVCSATWRGAATSITKRVSSSSSPPSATDAASAPASSHTKTAADRPKRRVTRRTNYADRDALLHDGQQTWCGQDATTADAARQYAAQLHAAQHLTRAGGQVSPRRELGPGAGAMSSSSSLRSWSACRDRVLLELLQTRTLGVSWCVSLWWRHVMPYAAYVGLGGPIEFYTRRSIAPPPCTSCAHEAHDPSAHAADEPVTWQHSVPYSRGLLKDRAHEAIYIGSSPIHSRGLFTRVKLARGTRVLTEPQRSFLLTPSFLRLLADTHEKLPETWHYTHPSGALPELVLQAQPHHLLNHSCAPNVVAGLSPLFWDAAAATGRVDLLERMASWAYFADPNSFFLARDVEAGEELTIDYSVRVAPMTAAANSAMDTGAFLHVCRCGAPSCRQFIYRARPELHAYLHGGTGEGGGHHPRRGRRYARRTDSCFAVARDLLRLGLDDETVLLSHLPSRAPLVAYVHGCPLHELAAPGTVSSTVMDMHRRKFPKNDVILCYRHVFRDLNEAAPQEAAPRTQPGANEVRDEKQAR